MELLIVLGLASVFVVAVELSPLRSEAVDDDEGEDLDEEIWEPAFSQELEKQPGWDGYPDELDPLGERFIFAGGPDEGDD